MALTINECTDERILYACGALHAKDIIDRLLGNVDMTNPIKSVTDRTVELKNLIPLYHTGSSKIQLDESDITVAKDKLGEEAVELLMMSNEQLNEKLENMTMNKVEESPKTIERRLVQAQEKYQNQVKDPLK